MNKTTKFGLPIGIMMAVLFALGLVSDWCLFAAAIFILKTEQEEWLRKAAKGAILAAIFFLLLYAGLDVLGYIIGTLSRMIGNYHSFFLEEIERVVGFIENIFYIIMIVIGLVSSYTHYVFNSADSISETNKEKKTGSKSFQESSYTHAPAENQTEDNGNVPHNHENSK